MRQTTVMVIEQERRTAVRLERQLRELGYAVLGPLASVELALARMVQEPELILIDLRLARGVSGRGALRRLRERSSAAIVFRAPRGHACDVGSELTSLACGYLVTPCEVQDLQAVLSIAQGRRAAPAGGAAQDERLPHERSVREVRDRLEAVLDALDEAVIAFDGAGRACHMNRSARALTGWAGDRGTPPPAEHPLRFVEPASGWHLENPAREALATGACAHLPPGALMVSPDGNEYAVHGHCGPLRNARGETIGAVLVLRHASALAAAQLARTPATEAGGEWVSACPPQEAPCAATGGPLRNAATRVADALAHDRLHLFAQRVAPVADPAACGEPGYEVLLRMEGETGALLPPTAFLPSDERDADMAELDRWVIRRTLETLAEAQARGERHARYAINLSVASVTDEGLLPFIAAQLERAGIAPERMCFEVAESTALAQMPRTIALAQGLQAIGCAFALDHFASGVGAREYLPHLPVTYIKIDGSVVKGMLEDQLDCAVVEGINRIGQALGIRTVAEHAESAAILGRLKELGVSQAQGFAIHRPEPIGRTLESHAELVHAAADPNPWSAEWHLQ